MTARHPDILTASEAAEYLGLAAVAPDQASALCTLARLVRERRVHPLRWAKTHLYHRADLDSFVKVEFSRLTDSAGAAAGEPAQRARQTATTPSRTPRRTPK